jgi:SAM domain (Sterile alpha motif)
VKSRNKLFTFLNHDGIPWHNNNAEHAIKAFSKLRSITRGSFTERSVKNDMILLSICQTCEYSNLEFFEFLRSGETDIYAFAGFSLKRSLIVATLRSGVRRTVQILRSLGLEQYEAAFRENAIDDTVLQRLTEENLKDLGVNLVGHRLKLLDAFAALRADAAKDAAERRQVTVMFSDLVA